MQLSISAQFQTTKILVQAMLESKESGLQEMTVIMALFLQEILQVIKLGQTVLYLVLKQV